MLTQLALVLITTTLLQYRKYVLFMHETWTLNLSILTTCFVLYPDVYPPTGLIAQRINVYRGMGSYKPAAGQTEEAEGGAQVSNAAAVLFPYKFDINKDQLRIDSPLAMKCFCLNVKY